jgi:peptide/nickel transport system permease protein
VAQALGLDIKNAATLAKGQKKSRNRFVTRWLSGAKPIIGLSLLVIIISGALLAPIIAPYSPTQTDFSIARNAPSLAHWFGTDNLGRDILSRVIYGGRISLLAGITPILISVSIGSILGLIAGYFRGWPEHVIMRAADAMMAFPPLVLTFAIIYALGPNLRNALIAIGITMIPEYIRVIRGQVLTLREREFVQAALVIGAGSPRILWRHITPNLLAPIIVCATIGSGRAILIEASLSYLGLGVQPPKASWGSMIQMGYTYLDQAPWMAIFPGLAIILTVLSLNFLGDSLRDALDPRLRK